MGNVYPNPTKSPWGRDHPFPAKYLLKMNLWFLDRFMTSKGWLYGGTANQDFPESENSQVIAWRVPPTKGPSPTPP